VCGVGARGRDDAARLLPEPDGARPEVELGPADGDVPGLQKLEPDIAGAQALGVIRDRGLGLRRPQIETPGRDDQPGPGLLLQLGPGLVCPPRQGHVGRRVIGEPDDAGVVLGRPALVSELELFEAEDLASRPARQPVRGRAAEGPEADDDVSVFGLHAFAPRPRWVRGGPWGEPSDVPVAGVTEANSSGISFLCTRVGPAGYAPASEANVVGERSGSRVGTGSFPLKTHLLRGSKCWCSWS
jgi:hypothetical protein